MKRKLRPKWVLLTALLGLTSINSYANEEINMNNHQLKEASMIAMTSQPNHATKLEDFLKAGGSLVKETEPNTKTWFALKGENSSFIIFDAFLDNQGREAHFAGQVAAALKDNSEAMIRGGWDEGVLNHITNSKILSSKTPDYYSEARLVNYIVFKAKQGQSEALAELLTGAAARVEQTEPGTSFWFALQLTDDTFAIFDAFSDKAGQDAHFSGEVAGALKKNAEALIEGGWENGVLPNIKNFEVITNI